MYDHANQGDLKAMYILGENPVLTDPNSEQIQSALTNLEFLVVHDLFLTETALAFADVVLPGWPALQRPMAPLQTTSAASRECARPSSPIPGKANWQTIIILSAKMGYQMDYPHPRADLCGNGLFNSLVRSFQLQRDRRKGNGMAIECRCKMDPCGEVVTG